MIQVSHITVYPFRNIWSRSRSINLRCLSSSLSAHNRCSSSMSWCTNSLDFLSIATLGARSFSSNSGIQSLRSWKRHFRSSRLWRSRTLWVARLISLSSESSFSMLSRRWGELRLPRLDFRGLLQFTFSTLGGANSSCCGGLAQVTACEELVSTGKKKIRNKNDFFFF